MLELAEVVGIEPHLTVPSRDNPKGVDIWVAIRRASIGVEWEQHFNVLAAERARHSGLGSFQPVPFTERRGWVVARSVDVTRVGTEDVVAAITALVAECNAAFSKRVAPDNTDGVKPARGDAWAVRARAAFASGSANTANAFLALRRGGGPDIASNS